MSEERRDYIGRLAMALIDGDTAWWTSATEEERAEAREYLRRAGILVPEDSAARVDLVDLATRARQSVRKSVARKTKSQQELTAR